MKERVADARWTLERQLAWISSAEVKVAVVVTVLIAMLAGLGAVYMGVPKKSAWAIGSTGACVFMATVAMWCAAMALKPNLSGPSSSLLYFGKISAFAEPDYSDKFSKATDAELPADLTAQIHRNAEIAGAKHKWVGRAIMIAFMAAVPWLAALALLGA